MTAQQLLQLITQVPFVLIFLVTLYDAVRWPRRANVDIALLFGTLAAIIAITWVSGALNVELDYPADRIAGVLLMALPHLLVRLVDDFSVVPRWVKTSSLALLVLSIAILALFNPLPGPLTIPLIAYFVVGQSYVAVRFVHEAQVSSGVTRRRMQAAAVGSGMLGLVVGMAVLGALNETLASAGSQLAGLASAIAYLIAFAPPAILKRAWQEPELRAFLAEAAQLPRLPDTPSIVAALELGAAHAVGAPAAAVALWNDELNGLVAPSYIDQPQARVAYEGDRSPVAISFFEQRATLVDDATGMDPANAEAYQAFGATAILAAPVTAGERRLGALAIFSPRAPLFDRDDLALVRLLANHAAVILESRHLIDEAARVQAREEATALKDDFLSAVAHDLKTPLTTLIAQAQLLRRQARRHPDEPPSIESLDQLVSEADRLRQLISGLLEFSRGEVSFAIEQAPVDIVEVARSVATSLRTASHPVTVEGDHFVAAYCDRARLTQVFENLVGNAIKYSPHGGPITITVRREDDQALLAVRDEGIGIPRSDLPHIFDRFQRGRHLDDRRYQGMGLGLFICRRIVDQHGGRIWVDSEPGIGSTFHVALPAAVEMKGTP